jgi:hypothetical protein
VLIRVATRVEREIADLQCLDLWPPLTETVD